MAWLPLEIPTGRLLFCFVDGDFARNERIHLGAILGIYVLDERSLFLL
jgi:hypothetical protein